MSERINRRRFLGASAAAGAAMAANDWSQARAQTRPATKSAGSDACIWALLVHLTDNMWCDWDAPGWGANHGVYRPTMQFDDQVWNSLLEPMAQAGVNMVVMDLGDGVK